MKLVIIKTIVFLTINFFCGFAVSCENGENEDLYHNYDLRKLIKKSAEHIEKSKSLKSLSKEDKDFVNEFEKFLSASINPASLLDFISNTSNKCVEDLKYALENIQIPGGWAMKMVDSYGKPGSGILMGHFKWLGQYDECVGIYAPSKKNTSYGDFHGKYCTLQVPLKLGNVSLPISTAVCLPDSCNPNIFKLLQMNWNGSFTFMDGNVEIAFSNATLTCKTTPKKLTSGAIGVICFLSVFVLLAVIGSSITAFEHFMKSKVLKEGNSGSSTHLMRVNSTDLENVSQGETKDAVSSGAEDKTLLPAYIEKYKPFFNCFCIITNGEKLLNTSSSEGQLPFLHGIRFFSMTWVILCHTYGGIIDILTNPVQAIEDMDHWTFQVVMNGFFCVDSFFVLSGFLVGYLFFQQAQKTDGKIPWLYFYIHRYIRLTPVYMIAIAIFTTIAPFLGSGPFWPDGDIVRSCQGSWWWNLLYINNFQPNLKENQCMAWSWYLSNDMQFYVISPLFLIAFWRWPKAGYSLVGLCFCITFICNFVITYEYDIIAGLSNILKYAANIKNVMPKIDDLFIYLYYKPYARIGPYLIGLLLAYYVYKRKCNNSPSLNWVTLTVGWLVASGITLTVQFGLYHQDISTVGAAFYNAFKGTGFGLGLGWLMFVCVIGQGGVVNSILSCKAFIPLSRLTYCAYLMHPIVENTIFNALRQTIFFTHANVTMLYLGLVVISYAVALVMSLLFESPVIKLERLVRNKFSS